MPRMARKEYDLIRLFLSEYEDRAWESAQIDWLDQRMQGAVDALVRKADGFTLAIEHTLIEPFPGDWKDFAAFKEHFLPLEADHCLLVPGRTIRVHVPVGLLKKGSSWDDIAGNLRAYLLREAKQLPEGSSIHQISLPAKHRRESYFVQVEVIVRLEDPDYPGSFSIRRDRKLCEAETGICVEIALKKKIPKLAASNANRKLLMLERDQVQLEEENIIRQVDERRREFAELACIDELWIVDTSFADSQVCGFRQYECGHRVQTLEFKDSRIFEVTRNGKTVGIRAR